MNTTDKIMELIDEWALLASHDPMAKRHTIRLEIEALVESNAAKADRIDRLGEMVEKLKAENEALVRDAERLNWMIFHSAKVRHSSDGEFCTVTWYDDEGQVHETKPFGSARQAIDAAMQEKQS